MAVEKFTLSEVYQDEKNRVVADIDNPIKEDTLMFVSESDNGSYQTKIMDYKTLYSSLCSSMEIQNIYETINNNNSDNIGISGDYPCFFEMYSSSHFNSKGVNEAYYISPVSDDVGELNGLFGIIWSGKRLSGDVKIHGTLSSTQQYSDADTQPPIIVKREGPTSFLSSFICLNPFKLFKNEHPDPQLVTITMSSRASCGVYIDHLISSNDGQLWQRTPIFTYNPDTAADYIATYKFILTPGSRFGIFGKNEFFNDASSIILTITNTQGHLVKQETTLDYKGSNYSSTIKFEQQKSSSGGMEEYVPKTFHVHGPIFGSKIGVYGCINLQMSLDGVNWSDVASKIYTPTKGTYVDFGYLFVKKNTSFRYYITNTNISNVGTSKIGAKSYINGSIYFEEASEIPTTIYRPLVLHYKSNGNHKADQYSNIQCKFNGSDVLTQVSQGSNNIFRKTPSSADLRYYQVIGGTTYDIKVECGNLTPSNPIMFYVASPSTNLTNEFKKGTGDGKNSGVWKIDGTHADCNMTNLPNKCAYRCTDLEEAKFNNQLTGIGSEAFRECTTLTTVKLPNVQVIGKNAFHQCTALHDFNNDTDGFSTIPAGATLSANAFYKTGLLKLKLDSSDYNRYKASAFDTLTLADLRVNYGNFSKNLAFDNTTITNLSINLRTSHSNGIYLPLLDSDCKVTNLTATGKNASFPALSSQLSAYKVQNVYFEKLGELRQNGCASLTSLTAINFQDTNVAVGYCKSCTNLNNVTVKSTEIRNNAFNGCTKLERANLTCTTIGSNAFNNCSKMTTLTMSNVTTIGESAFSNCKALVSTTMPEKLTTLGKEAFYNCTALKGEGTDGQINLSSVTSFANGNVFRNTNIQQVLIGSGVTTSLDSYTFGNCDNMNRIYFNHTNTAANLRTIYKILVGKDITAKDNITYGSKKTSNICNGCAKQIQVFCNCKKFEDTQFKVADINGKNIEFRCTITAS